MSLDGCYVQTQIDLLNLHLALAGEFPKRSGDFETTYKTESGKEVIVKRSPDGKFANKSSNGATEQAAASTINTAKDFGKIFSSFTDDIAKMPAKAQDAVRKVMFESELSRAIDKQVEKFIKSAYSPGLEAGFKLGQSIKNELAKKPFSKFAETIATKFEEFKKDLPKKSDNLRKEIIRIATDPNTATTVAAGALMALAGNFYLAGLFSAVRAGQITFALTKLPAVETLAAEYIAELTPVLSATLTESQIEIFATAQAATTLAMAKSLGTAAVAGNAVMGIFYNMVGGILTSQAGRAIMNSVKKNEALEKEQLKEKILAEPKDSDVLYQQQLEQQAKDAETRRKILEKLSEGMPKKREDLNPDKPETFAGMPALDIRLTDSEEAFAADPKRREQILAVAYKDEEFLKLSFAYLEAQGLALVASLSDKEVEEQFLEIRDRAKKAIEDRLAAAVKAEIKRLQLLEAEK